MGTPIIRGQMVAWPSSYLREYLLYSGTQTKQNSTYQGAFAVFVGPLLFNYAEYDGSLPALGLNPNSWTKVCIKSSNLENVMVIKSLHLLEPSSHTY